MNIYKSTAKRKTAIAKVFLIEGLGNIFLNNKKLINKNIKEFIIKPIIILNLQKKFDINIFSSGGGYQAQLNAICLALSKTLILINITYKLLLKKNSLLTSDSRIKERRKYGLKKARKASQYSKR
jgi:small subunit ribosomal protein S9